MSTSTALALHVGDGTRLPIELVTESNGILGKKGSGKTSAGIVLLEEMFAAGVPVVTIDPKGDHYGIRSSADGKAEGLPIPVFGGRHGDLPLEPTAGTYIADLVLSRRLSCVIDVSEFSIAERRRFLTAFADRLYRAAERDPMHLFLEECHEYIPQFVKGDDAAMVGVFERLVKNGRFKGIGVTLLSQRSASVNKNVLTQVDNLFVMRTVAKQDRDAIKGWIVDNADSAEILAQLPALQNGETWLWQPARGEPIHFRFRMRSTFDAGHTPKVGEKRVQPTTLADVDLSAIEQSMADAIERVKADDPKELRRKIAALEKQLRERPSEKVTETVVERVEVQVPVLSADDRSVIAEIDGMLKGLAHALPQYRAITERVSKSTEPRPERPLAPRQSAPRTASVAPPTSEARGSRSDRTDADEAELTAYQRKMLTVLAQFPHLSVKQLAMRSGYSFKSSAFSANVAALRRAGLVEGVGAQMSITASGREALGEYEALPTGPALIDHWMRTLKPTEANMLRELIEVWPGSLTTEEISERTGYSMTSSSFSAALASLKKWELAAGGKDGMRADDILGEAHAG